MVREFEHQIRGEEWSVSEQFLYELAWYETKFREAGDRKGVNQCRKLRKMLEDH